jgi:hypothetical protein
MDCHKKIIITKLITKSRFFCRVSRHGIHPQKIFWVENIKKFIKIYKCLPKIFSKPKEAYDHH